MTNDDKLRQVLIHLPDNVEELKKIAKLVLKEAAALDLASFSTVHKALVESRGYSDAVKKAVRERSFEEDAMSVFLAIPKKRIESYKGDFRQILIDYPGANKLSLAIYKELEAIGYADFTYLSLMKAVEKRLHVIIPGKKRLQPFVYMLLRDSKYTRRMSYNHAKRTSESVFSLAAN